MPGAFTTDLVLIKAAEVTADYLVLGTFASARALNDDIKVEGTNAINGRVSANTAWGLAATPSANLDLSGTDVHVFMWIRTLTWPSMDTKANGGLGISISSDVTPTLTGTTPSNGPTNSGTWYLAGSDTDAVAGWVCYVVNPNGTPDLTLGTYAANSVDRVGLRAKVTGTVSNKTLNIQDDVIRYGTGLTVNDGTSGAPVAMTDIYTHDSNNARAWGIVTQVSGIYFVAGKLRIGTTGQTAVTHFKDTNQVIVCPKFPVTNTLYEINLAGAGSFATTFQLGDYTASLASSGVTIRGAGDPGSSTHAVWNLTADAANTVCLLYASAFSELRRASFRSNSEIRACTFTNFGNITAGGALFDECEFIDLKTTTPISATYGIEAVTTAPTITNCAFVDCATAILWNVNADTNTRLDGSSFTSGGTGHAIELGTNCPTAITLTEVGFTGYGGTPGSNPTQSSGSTDAAIYNNSGKTITITITDGTTPAIRNGAGATTVVVTGAVTLTVKVQNVAKVAIQNAQTSIHLAASPFTVLMNEDTNASGIATEAYSYVSDVEVVVRVRKSEAGDSPRYVAFSDTQTITASGLSLTVTLKATTLPI